MAKLIVKSPYIKCGGGKSASGYLNYIGTRENVELIPDDRPPTRKQEQLVTKLVNDFPDTKKSFEYEEYSAVPTKANASAFITMALESNWNSVQKSTGYMNYIATRPRAERFGDHGLFGDEDKVSLSAAMNELDNYTGNVWTHIISLRREDAARLGFDNAKSWQALIRTHRNDIADAMKISPNNFRWYAAYHDEGEHPHIHMMAWSTDPKEAYLSREGIQQIKSELTNTIFQNEMLHLYEQKSASRDELVRQARSELLRMTKLMSEGLCDNPRAEQLMQQLVVELNEVKGKKMYGYLPKPRKELVCKIVDQMAQMQVVRQCYDRWLELQGKIESYYHDREQVRLKLSEQKEFGAIRNAVIYEAERIRTGGVTFEDRGIDEQDEPEEFRYSTYDYGNVRDIIRDDSLSMDERMGAVKELYSMSEAEDVHAQYLLGKLYQDGPLLIPNAREAAYWFEKAARQGLAEAQYALGKMYLSEDIEVRDPELGIQWLAFAAQNGSDYAAYRLGKEYMKGETVERNTAKAVGYFDQAAKAGNQHAQYMLGKMHLMGEDVPYDKGAAFYYLSGAAEQGHEYAEFFADRIHEDRSPQLMIGITQVLHHMSRIFRDNSLPQSTSAGIQIDRKRLARLQEKRMAMGHKRDDHPDHKGPNMAMSMY